MSFKFEKIVFFKLKSVTPGITKKYHPGPGLAKKRLWEGMGEVWEGLEEPWEALAELLEYLRSSGRALEALIRTGAQKFLKTIQQISTMRLKQTTVQSSATRKKPAGARTRITGPIS